VTTTYVDAGILIAGYRAQGVLGHAALSVLSDPNRAFVSSAFVRLEVLPKAVHFRNHTEASFYDAFFARVVAWADLNSTLIDLAEREGTRHGLNALDALHVAAAVVLGAEELVTTEGPRKPIHRATGVRVVGL